MGDFPVTHAPASLDAHDWTVRGPADSCCILVGDERNRVGATVVEESMDSNERNTENLERDVLRALDHYDLGNIICVEEQKSVIG